MLLTSTKNILLSAEPVATYNYKNLSALSKPQIFELLAFLTEKISKSFIMMGGLLFVIRKNKWYDPHPTFMAFCDDLVGISYRKAMQLIQIYESLIDNHIPFEEISEVGFTKMVLISPHLSEANYADLIAWAKNMTTQGIEEELKLAASKSKSFIDKVQANSALEPDAKVGKKLIKAEVSVLKNLLTVTSIDMVLDALRVLYPDKEFALA